MLAILFRLSSHLLFGLWLVELRNSWVSVGPTVISRYFRSCLYQVAGFWITALVWRGTSMVATYLSSRLTCYNFSCFAPLFFLVFCDLAFYLLKMNPTTMPGLSSTVLHHWWLCSVFWKLHFTSSTVTRWEGWDIFMNKQSCLVSPLDQDSEGHNLAIWRGERMFGQIQGWPEVYFLLLLSKTKCEGVRQGKYIRRSRIAPIYWQR